MHPVVAYVALGANLGAPLKQIQRALEMLASNHQLCQISPIYRSRPTGAMTKQPDFLNLVVEIITTVAPEELLQQLLMIEQLLGRRRQVSGGPRLIDLDLITYGDEVMVSARLHLPHPRAHERDFVLRPLADLNPHWIHPRLGHSAAELLNRLGETTIH